MKTLVMKLQGVVDNDNLDVFGFFKMRVNVAEGATGQIGLRTFGTTSAAPWTIMTKDGTSKLKLNSADAYSSKILITSEYSGNLFFAPGNYEVLFDSNGVRALGLSGSNQQGANLRATLDLNDLKYTKCRSLVINNFKLKGYFKNLTGFTEKVSSESCAFVDKDYEDFKDLAYVPYVKTTTDLSQNFKDTSIRGNIEDFVAVMREQEITTGTKTFFNITSVGAFKIYFNGNQVYSPNANTTISWTATTITCNGITIDA